jgi:hypothetical protein
VRCASVNAAENPLRNVAGGYARTVILSIAAKPTMKETYLSVVGFTERT